MDRKPLVIQLPESERLLRASEVARMLNVSRSMIYRLIEQGELPTVRVGHALRFRSEDVHEYIRKRARGTAKRRVQTKKGKP